jgi:hypothetical protein
MYDKNVERRKMALRVAVIVAILLCALAATYLYVGLTIQQEPVGMGGFSRWGIVPFGLLVAIGFVLLLSIKPFPNPFSMIFPALLGIGLAYLIQFFKPLHDIVLPIYNSNFLISFYKNSHTKVINSVDEANIYYPTMVVGIFTAAIIVISIFGSEWSGYFSSERRIFIWRPVVSGVLGMIIALIFMNGVGAVSAIGFGFGLGWGIIIVVSVVIYLLIILAGVFFRSS